MGSEDSGGYDGGTGTIWLDNVQCKGTERDMSDCQHRGWGVHNCRHSQDVSISCNSERHGPRKLHVCAYNT